MPSEPLGLRWRFRSLYAVSPAPQAVLVNKNLPASAEDLGDAGSSPGFGSCPGEGSGTPPPSSCLGNPMDKGAWRAPVQGVNGSRTGLSTAPSLSGSQRAGRLRSWRVGGWVGEDAEGVLGPEWDLPGDRERRQLVAQQLSGNQGPDDPAAAGGGLGPALHWTCPTFGPLLSIHPVCMSKPRRRKASPGTSASSQAPWMPPGSTRWEGGSRKPMDTLQRPFPLELAPGAG